MDQIEQINLLASALAVIALVNWLAGDRSFGGKDLLIRRDEFWIRCRWFGLGLWLATQVGTSSDNLLLGCVGLVGALVLLFGTARKKFNADEDEVEYAEADLK